MSARGFTLFEVLAVVVLMTIAMAATAAGIAGASDSARWHAASAGLLDLDQRARLEARTGRTVLLVLDRRGVRLVDQSTGEELAEFSIPAGISVVLSEAGTPVSSILFDRTGCSHDYLVTSTAAAGNKRLRIAGLTGWSDVPEGSEP